MRVAINCVIVQCEKLSRQDFFKNMYPWHPPFKSMTIAKFEYFETKMVQWYHNGDAWCWPVLHAPSYQCITLPSHTSACTHYCAGRHRPSGRHRYCLNYCGMSQQGGGGAYSEIEQSKEGIEERQMMIISTLRLNMTHSTYTVMHIVHVHTLS